MKIEEAKQIVDTALGELETALEGGHSKAFQAYLNLAAKFTEYSFRNTMLVFAQNPNASMVAGFQAWKKRKRWVRKGEQAIWIMAPMAIKSEPDAMPAAASVPKVEIGNKSNCDVESVMRFKAVAVFDVVQTEGEPLAEYDQMINGGVVGTPGRWLSVLEALIQGMGIKLETKVFPGDEQGYCLGDYIAVRSGLTDGLRFSVLVHEFAHSCLHFNGDLSKTNDSLFLGYPVKERLTKRVKEIEAEAVAFTVCRAFGIDALESTHSYLSSYSIEAGQLRLALPRIQYFARKLIGRLHELAGE